MKKTTKDKVAGFAAIIFGLSMVFYFIPNWVVMNAHIIHTSPDTFPRFASYALIILGVALVIQAYMAERKEKNISNSVEKNVSVVKSWNEFKSSDTYCVLATVISILLFDFLLKKIGYIPTGCICSVFLLAAFRSKKWYHYVIVIAFTFLLYFIFGKVLLVKMP